MIIRGVMIIVLVFMQLVQFLQAVRQLLNIFLSHWLAVNMVQLVLVLEAIINLIGVDVMKIQVLF